MDICTSSRIRFVIPSAYGTLGPVRFRDGSVIGDFWINGAKANEGPGDLSMVSKHA